MEIYQIVLMVIGAITLVWLSYKVLKGFIWCLDAGLASCFREKYPYDFEFNLGWVIKDLKSRGETSRVRHGNGNTPPCSAVFK